MLAALDLSVDGRLAGVSATLQPGSITAICGPNGAGKSTLLSCLAGLLKADAGIVTLDRQALRSIAPAARAQAIGYLPQTPDVAWDLSVMTLVELGRLPWRSSVADDREAVEAALVAMQLAPLRHRRISQLSGGERGRALVARVLAGQPRWVLADEPLANLDLAHQLALLAQFRTLAAAGIGVVVVLHDLALAMNHAHRVLVLQDGALIADDAPAAALSATVIAQGWGVQARWLGEPGQRALTLLPT